MLFKHQVQILKMWQLKIISLSKCYSDIVKLHHFITLWMVFWEHNLPIKESISDVSSLLQPPFLQAFTHLIWTRKKSMQPLKWDSKMLRTLSVAKSSTLIWNVWEHLKTRFSITPLRNPETQVFSSIHTDPLLKLRQMVNSGPTTCTKTSFCGNTLSCMNEHNILHALDSWFYLSNT